MAAAQATAPGGRGSARRAEAKKVDPSPSVTVSTWGLASPWRSASVPTPAWAPAAVSPWDWDWDWPPPPAWEAPEP
jgi:hypothetical protein